MWVQATADIHAVADNNPNVRLRFELTGDPGLHMGGWNIDDVRIVATNATGVAELTPPSSRLRLWSTPNPSDRMTSITLRMPAAGAAAVQIFDSNGRLVKDLLDGSLDSGDHRILWVGTDNAGRLVPAGTYFCRARTGDQMRSIRLVRLPQ